jgi:hypothetical protein
LNLEMSMAIYNDRGFEGKVCFYICPKLHSWLKTKSSK